MPLRQFLVFQVALLAVAWAIGLWSTAPNTAHADEAALQQRIQRLEALAKANATYFAAWNTNLDQQIRSTAARVVQSGDFVNAVVKADPEMQKIWNQIPGLINWQSPSGNNQLTSAMGWTYGDIVRLQSQWQSARNNVR